MRFLADERCDFIVVRALRVYDVGNNDEASIEGLPRYALVVDRARL